MGEMPVLSGMLFCADCGAKLYQVRARGWTHEQEHFVCATYRKQKGKCTSHQIRNVQVEQILLTEINRMLTFVREREGEFVELLTKKNECDLKGASLRDFIPWKNIGIVGEIRLCRFFLFLGQSDCSDEVPMDEDGLLFRSGTRHLLRLEHINALYQGADDFCIQLLNLGVRFDLCEEGIDVEPL